MADKKNDDTNNALAWLILAALGLLGGIQLYRTRITPWATEQLARLEIDGTSKTVGSLTTTDLAALIAVIATAVLLAVLVRSARRLFRRNTARSVR